VSIDDLVKHAGLTRGGFYNHFSGKDELYAEAVRSFVSCNPFDLAASSEADPDVKEQLGHGSIQITVNTYGHLIRGASRGAVNRLDEVRRNQPQPRRNRT
jgi:AcrR family transcriptional regulator